MQSQSQSQNGLLVYFIILPYHVAETKYPEISLKLKKVHAVSPSLPPSAKLCKGSNHENPADHAVEHFPEQPSVVGART